MRPWAFFLILFTAAVTLTGCDFIGGVIKFTFWTGVVAVLVVIGIIWFIIRALKD